MSGIILVETSSDKIPPRDTRRIVISHFLCGNVRSHERCGSLMKIL